MLQLVYASAATAPFSPQDLDHLLRRARPRNDLYKVTGLLLYHSGSFLQVLEGPEAGVDAIYAHIVRDRRHSAAKVLSRLPITRREFENWSMAFADTSASLQRPAGFMDYHRQLPALSDAPTRAAQYLRFFQQGLCRQSPA